MTYKWAKEFTLELIDQETIAGTEVAPTYNNQADYLRKIPRLLDDAAVIAATSGHRIRATAELVSLEHRAQGDYEVYALPENCWQLCSSGLIRLVNGRIHRFQRYHLIGRDGIAVPVNIAKEDGVMLEYWRYPALLGEKPADNAELDNTIEVQMALPYYAAARLVMLDNSFAYAALYNEFEGKLAAGRDLPQATLGGVEDIYGC